MAFKKRRRGDSMAPPPWMRKSTKVIDYDAPVDVEEEELLQLMPALIIKQKDATATSSVPQMERPETSGKMDWMARLKRNLKREGSYHPCFDAENHSAVSN